MICGISPLGRGGGSEGDRTYFLGSIVSYENEGTQEIIDGQQRITSLFLLLRAIYTALTQADVKSKEAENFIKQIEPALWRTNKLAGEVDFSNILLESKVLNNEGNDILRGILQTGTAKPEATDNYSKNYLKFQELFAAVSKDNPLMIYEFIYVVLNKAILLPITADSQDTALTIFSTLNDRGLPLSDADIFKAKIYNQLTPEEKVTFIDRWKDLTEDTGIARESIQQLFYYYTFYLRALDKDSNSTIPGIRKYYFANKYEKLFAPDLLDNLFIMVRFWSVVNAGQSLEEESWTKNADILKSLDTLTAYPNEFWKYPVIIFYLIHRLEEDFEETFNRFLHKLLRELLTKYLIIPTINAVKTDILKLNVDIVSTSKPAFDFRTVDTSKIDERIISPHRSIIRMILKILSHKKQDSLLPARWEIEHIFPQKWQTNYFPNVDDETVKKKIEHIGNKVPFEKKLNIVAGNGYFKKKQELYKQSDIAIVRELSSADIGDWDLNSIGQRDGIIVQELLAVLEQWDSEYQLEERAEGPTDEELAMIDKFKKRGWV